ncbi:MAG: 23S rRNA (guanosine(2251)-2'-O)-methyltransferase RlmB [Bacteroidota bacterium]
MKKQPPKDNAIFGIRAILESIHSGKEIDKLFIQKQLGNPLIKELIGLAKSHGIPMASVPIEKLNRITRKNHQGAIAFVSAVQYSSLDNIISETYQKGKEPLLLLLDRVTDVRNFGAIVRSAECAGVNGIIIPSKGGAAVNSDAMKTSAGALNYVPICRSDNLKSTIHYLKSSGIKVVGCTEKTDQLIYDTDFQGPVCIIMGSEEDGISSEYLKLCDARGKIPITGNVESLNVSVSCGIILFEALRQKQL